MGKLSWTELLPDLYLYKDTCNVYLLKSGDEAVVFDFGSGTWMESLPEIGVQSIRHVFLTHPHRDQCAGLATRTEWPFDVHASTQDLRFYRPDTLAGFWKTYQSAGCPANYAAPRLPLPFVKGNVADAQEISWANTRICAIPTPGHTRGALTYIVAWNGKSLAFCGDAIHHGGTIHQPYHLEWDHWTGEGALAAWHGLERLGYCRIDRLCPSHGPVVQTSTIACIRRAQKHLMAFIRAKGSVCPGEIDRWVSTEPLVCGAQRVLPNLYHFGANSFLLVGDNAEGLVIDPTLSDIESIGALIKETGVQKLTAATATHYHRDHSDGLNWLRDHYGTAIWLHPWVAEPIKDRNQIDVPWLPSESIQSDRTLPETGVFRWNQYRFNIRPFPGQTWWHCAFDTTIAGVHVLFSGDNFQPPSRWNGTGGFCAYNGARFTEGFARSAQTALDIAPDLIANGHGCIYRFHAGHYLRILRWSAQSENAVRNLCPADSSDYDCRTYSWSPFLTETPSGRTVDLAFEARNPTGKLQLLTFQPLSPQGWDITPAQRKITAPPGAERTARVTLRIPQSTAPGRYLVAANLILNGDPLGEVAVALVQVI
ncbi:MAG: MBL fold metallo-hydrolase [bacterium]|nr:MBL fold metallo-hydrolase [bacterium]